jgi:hypothetical protein
MNGLFDSEQRGRKANQALIGKPIKIMYFERLAVWPRECMIHWVQHLDPV